VLETIRKLENAPLSQPGGGNKRSGIGNQRGGTSAPAIGGSSSFSPQSAIAPQNYGSGNQNTVFHYTDNLAVPQTTLSFPNSPIGYFLFTFNGSSWFYCTATLISKSIIVAAGHCVHQGGNGAAGWITNGYFVPACWNCNTAFPFANFGLAQAASVYTTNGWFNTGALDAGYDVGIVVLQKKQGTSVEIGTETGWLGFCYLNCLQSNWYLTQRGYPGNYFGGNWVYEGQHHEVSDGADYVMGSGAQGGSSGGPHIANLDTLDAPPANWDGTPPQGQYPNRNIIFAVTSWGYIDTTIKIQGASSLSGPSNSNNFQSMFNDACTFAKGLHGASTCSTL
jgi:V8-like Glu-specific endopeptidase